MDLVKEYLFWVRGWPWHELRSLFELLLYFLAILAVLGCLLRLGTIRRIIAEFQNARSPIWDLRKTVDDLKGLEPVILELSGQMSLITERVDAARKQVAELQVEATSNRTDGSDQILSVGQQPSLSSAPPGVEDDDPNWLALRELWKRNTRRLEYVIEHQISDGRKRVAYDRIPRTNYERVINRLQGQGVITSATADASRSLNEIFNSYRPRNRKVPNSVIGGLQTLDQLLDKELVAFSKVESTEDDDSPPPPQPQATAPPPLGPRGNGQTDPNFPGQSHN